MKPKPVVAVPESSEEEDDEDDEVEENGSEGDAESEDNDTESSDDEKQEHGPGNGPAENDSASSSESDDEEDESLPSQPSKIITCHILFSSHAVLSSFSTKQTRKFCDPTYPRSTPGPIATYRPAVQIRAYTD